MSFRREKFIERGGPDGGDGGNGGNVIIYGDPSLNTLLHLHRLTTWSARRGGHGKGKKMTGGNGDDIMIPVPVGTIVRKQTPKGVLLIADITEEDQIVLARGGAGGLGNTRFVSAVNQEPMLAEKGAVGEKATLLFELKLLADVGVIGLPNAGKSTLLSTSTSARPKVASYPFTTLDPVLGVVTKWNKDLVMMEVPGLVEGAHMGVGLGHEFLRHSERARLLIHLIDGESAEPVEDWRRINYELDCYSPELAGKPQIAVVNKLDVPDVREKEQALEEQFSALDTGVLFISAATGEGVDTLLAKAFETLESLPKAGPASIPISLPAQEDDGDQGFSVTHDGDVYLVRAPSVERLVPLTDLRDWRVMIQLWREMERKGIVKELEKQGVTPGDTVRLAGVDLEWF